MGIVPTFEIFRVSSERDPKLVESVSGLLRALHRMEEIAADKPRAGTLFLVRVPDPLDAHEDGFPQVVAKKRT